jgi:hypothetical protein
MITAEWADAETGDRTRRTDLDDVQSHSLLQGFALGKTDGVGASVRRRALRLVTVPGYLPAALTGTALGAGPRTHR